jgi:hypothetical protein
MRPPSTARVKLDNPWSRKCCIGMFTMVLVSAVHSTQPHNTVDMLRTNVHYDGTPTSNARTERMYIIFSHDRLCRSLKIKREDDDRG